MIAKLIKIIYGKKSFEYKFYDNFRYIKNLDTLFSLKNIKEIYNSTLNDKKVRPTLNLDYLYSKYKFDYEDWFTHNIPIWNFYIKKLSKIKYLEIGTFEGRSVVFMAKTIKELISIDVVDTFKGSDEHGSMRIDFNKVYRNFKNNTNQFKDLLTIHKSNSNSFFKKNEKKFNLIYIDGSHHYADVLKDLINSYKFLEKDGIIICDDFKWTSYYQNKNENPALAIIKFIKLYKVKILYIGYQVILKKH